jgi:hypothetical protein
MLNLKDMFDSLSIKLKWVSAQGFKECQPNNTKWVSCTYGDGKGKGKKVDNFEKIQEVMIESLSRDSNGLTAYHTLISSNTHYNPFPIGNVHICNIFNPMIEFDFNQNTTFGPNTNQNERLLGLAGPYSMVSDRELKEYVGMLQQYPQNSIQPSQPNQPSRPNQPNQPNQPSLPNQQFILFPPSPSLSTAQSTFRLPILPRIQPPVYSNQQPIPTFDQYCLTMLQFILNLISTECCLKNEFIGGKNSEKHNEKNSKNNNNNNTITHTNMNMGIFNGEFNTQVSNPTQLSPQLMNRSIIYQYYFYNNFYRKILTTNQNINFIIFDLILFCTISNFFYNNNFNIHNNFNILKQIISNVLINGRSVFVTTTQLNTVLDIVLNSIVSPIMPFNYQSR